MKRLNSKKRFFLIGVAVVFLVALGLFLRFPPGPRPMCHRQIDGALATWMLKNGQTNTFPNVNGNGRASLALLEPYVAGDIQGYGYVPGLRTDDPTDLVFMYLKKMTRHGWHGDSEHSIFSPQRWMVLSSDILSGHQAEGGELLDTAEFRRRLLMTLAFLKEHHRPYSQAIADEQMKFLDSNGD